MTQEDYVSFETAKLLKEKGFDWECFQYWHEDDNKLIHSQSMHPVQNVSNPCFFGPAAPTIHMAVKWLRDVHGLIISVNFTVHGWLCEITKVFRDSNGFIVNINHGIGDDSLPYCDEHEVSSETAIKYCLENLI